MDKREHNKLINKNTLECWAVAVFIILVSSFLELLGNIRTIKYFLILTSILIIPFVITIIYYNIKDKSSTKIKYYFVISYIILYLFLVITSKSYITLIYIIPLLVLLVSYSDKFLTLFSIILVFIANVLSIYIQYNSLGKLYDIEKYITIWEIQIAIVILSSISVIKTSNLLKKRTKLIEDLSNILCKDVLTNSYNKKFLDTKISKIFNSKSNKCIAFIDIDDFKNFNTLYGHNFGDKVLVSFASTIDKIISKYKNTYLIRVGGDEFIIFSLDFNKENFKLILEEIMDKISKKTLTYKNKKVSIQISIGVSSTEIDKCKTLLELYDLADSRNRYAKENGKNYIEDTIKSS